MTTRYTDEELHEEAARRCGRDSGAFLDLLAFRELTRPRRPKVDDWVQDHESGDFYQWMAHHDRRARVFVPLSTFADLHAAEVEGKPPLYRLGDAGIGKLNDETGAFDAVTSKPAQPEPPRVNRGEGWERKDIPAQPEPPPARGFAVGDRVKMAHGKDSSTGTVRGVKFVVGWDSWNGRTMDYQRDEIAPAPAAREPEEREALPEPHVLGDPIDGFDHHDNYWLARCASDNAKAICARLDLLIAGQDRIAEILERGR